MQDIRISMMRFTRLKEVAVKMLPERMQACKFQHWDQFVSMMEKLDPQQWSLFTSNVLYFTPPATAENIFPRRYPQLWTDGFVDYVSTFQDHLQKAIVLVDERRRTSAPKLLKQLDVLRERILMALRQCRFVLRVFQPHKRPSTQDWKGLGLYQDWIVCSTEDLYWVAQFFQESAIIPTVVAYQKASQNIQDPSQWEPICYDDDGPSLLCHWSMMDPSDFLVRDEHKQSQQWAGIARFAFINTSLHDHRAVVRFGKQPTLAPKIVFHT